MVKHVSVLAHGSGNPQQPQPSPVRQIRPFLEGKLVIIVVVVVVVVAAAAAVAVVRTIIMHASDVGPVAVYLKRPFPFLAHCRSTDPTP
jgi:hypothetical protein